MFFDILLSKYELRSNKMTKKCKKLVVLKKMFENNNTDINLLIINELEPILGIF